MSKTQHYCGRDRTVDANRRFVNGVVGMTEHVMRELTGHGCRLNSLARTGRGDDRRNDKLDAARLGVPKAFRQYARHYHAH